MGVIRERDLPAVVDEPSAVIRQAEAGGMTVEFDQLAGNLDIDELFEGLPDNCCQTEHWGYVIEGEMRYEMASGEVIVALPGDAYYVPPGHRPHTGAGGARVVEFSRAVDAHATMRVIGANMARAAREAANARYQTLTG